MRIEAGPFSNYTSDGVFYGVDRRLSQSQVDVLDQVLTSRGLTPHDVCWVEFCGEGEPMFGLVRDVLAAARQELMLRGADA